MQKMLKTTAINKAKNCNEKKYVGIVIFAYLISFIFETYALTNMFIIVLLIAYYYEPSVIHSRGEKNEITNS